MNLKDTYRWSDPDVVVILSRDFFEEYIGIDEEMSDEFFEELKIEIRENLCAFVMGCYHKVEGKLPVSSEESATHN